MCSALHTIGKIARTLRTLANMLENAAWYWEELYLAGGQLPARRHVIYNQD